MKVHFAEGHEVAAGALLFTIDPRQLQSALLQAQATLAQHQAAVTSAEANLARDTAQLENARVDEQRYRKLVEGGFVAREQYDQIRTKELTLAATIDADRAAVETAKALVRAGEAAVENVRVQLSYTEIRAPIGGRTGNLLLNQGNVVKANDVGNPMVVINRVHPIYVAFSVPEAQIEAIKRYRAAGDLPVEAQVTGPAGRRRARPAHLHEQHGGPEHRDDPAQGHLREHRECPLAGPVRQRGPHPDEAGRRGAGALPGGAERPEGAVRVRGQGRIRPWRRGRWCRARPTGVTWSSRAGSPRGSAW